MNLLPRQAGGYRICLILGLIALFWSPNGEAGAPSEGARVLDGVKGFPPDYDSGSMAFYALSSCIEAVRDAAGYYSLVGVSGAAFKFVYDSTEAYEPLRDLYPVDVLPLAAEAKGFPAAHWEINKPIDTVKSLIKREIDGGRPLVAPFLKNDAYHGFFVIAGYDYERNILYLQGALGLDSGYVEVPIPDSWDGPTVSPEGWARNPVFVLGEMGPLVTERGAHERMSVEAGIRLLKGGTLEYGTHPGEHQYMRVPGPHRAHYGLPAYDILAVDVEKSLLLVDGGEQVLDSGLIWRLNSQLGQLQHDRHRGAAYLRTLSAHLPDEHSLLLKDIMDTFEKVVADVRSLRKVFWDPVPVWCSRPEDVVRYIEQKQSIVFRVPEDDGMLSALDALGYEAHGGPWGPVVVRDSPEKRLRAKMFVISILSREKNSLYLMEQIVDHIGRQPTDQTARKRVTGEATQPQGD